MKAVQYRKVGAKPEVVTVPDPEPGPGQVLLKVSAAGICHSDQVVMSWPGESFRRQRAWMPIPHRVTRRRLGTWRPILSCQTLTAMR